MDAVSDHNSSCYYSTDEPKTKEIIYEYSLKKRISCTRVMDMNKQHRRMCALCLAAGFLLGLRDGRLTLWQEGDRHPLQIYDIRESSLPPADRLLLRRGIRAESREELWLILENYLS